MKKYLLLTLVVSLSVVLFFSSCKSSADKEKKNEKDSIVEMLKKPKVDLKKYNRIYNDMSRLLAGLPQEEGSTLKGYDSLRACKEYSKSIGEFFAKVKGKNFAKMEKFRDAEMKDVIKDSMTVFYPFSGPDFLHVATLFPGARTTVMFGLEPVGNIPNIKGASENEMTELFKALRTSIDSLAPLGYFMTNDMRTDFRRIGELNGTLPVMAIFMQHSGYRVLDVRRMPIDENGKLVDSIPGFKDKNPQDDFVTCGVIEYMKPEEDFTRKLYYISQDVDDAHLNKVPQFMKFVTSFQYDVAFMKAASYLCSWMKTVRETVLSQSKAVVQDDSGIPVKYFDNDHWTKRFYGRYARTLKVFEKAFFQKDLKEIYDTTKMIKPINFAFGYGVRINQSNLMIAKKKPTTDKEPAKVK